MINRQLKLPFGAIWMTASVVAVDIPLQTGSVCVEELLKTCIGGDGLGRFLLPGVQLFLLSVRLYFTVSVFLWSYQ